MTFCVTVVIKLKKINKTQDTNHVTVVTCNISGLIFLCQLLLYYFVSHSCLCMGSREGVKDDQQGGAGFGVGLRLAQTFRCSEVYHPTSN